MPGIYFARISNDKSGFTNQIFSLVNSILIANSKRYNIVVLDSFQRDFSNSKSKIDCCKLFNLDETNKNLKDSNIGVTLICKSKFHYKLNAVLYGSGEKVIDITEQIPSIIKPGTYNYIGGDPYPDVPKELFINYSINDIEYSDIYNESYSYNIFLMNQPNYYEYMFQYVNKSNKNNYETIMRCIVYQSMIDNINFLPVYNKFTEKINVIHLRLEKDAIEHWSKQNKLPEQVFEQKIYEKYIHVIEENIDKKYKTIVVGSKYNKVIDFLDKNHYDYIYYDLNLDGRELNALYDLVQATECNETFISNFDYEHLRGSSFSYYISILSNPKKMISIDIDNVHSNPIMYISKN